MVRTADRREGAIPVIDRSDHPKLRLACMMEGVSELAPRDAAKPSHPLRAAILNALADREASPVELAKEMGESLANVSYHVRELHKLGAVALVRQRQVRGAVEHTYIATVRISLRQEPL
jgi:DNA-binding transcriptional ArsR family regulator